MLCLLVSADDTYVGETQNVWAIFGPVTGLNEFLFGTAGPILARGVVVPGGSDTNVGHVICVQCFLNVD